MIPDLMVVALILFIYVDSLVFLGREDGEIVVRSGQFEVTRGLISRLRACSKEKS